MKQSFLLRAPLHSIVWINKASLAQQFLCTILVILGSLFLALASQIAIPLQPAPITLQTLVVLFLG